MRTPLISKFFLTVVFLVHSFVPAIAQKDASTSVANVILEASGTPAATTERLDAILAPVTCDNDGNLYFRKLGGDPGSSPLTRLAANGTAAVVFDANRLPGNSREADMLAFTVDGQGRVHQIVRMSEGKKVANYLVVYSKEGEVATRTKLELDFIPAAFTALETGDYFVSGITMKKSRDDIPSSMTALLDGSGRVKMNLKGPADDSRPIDPAARVGSSKLPAIENGTSIYGADKNIYLFRASDPVQLKVISPAGGILRDERLAAPFRGAEPFEFRMANGRILVGYRPAQTGKEARENIQPVYLLYDIQSLEPILQYGFGESIRGALACFTGDRFTFLTGTRDGRFAILEAKAK